MNFSANRTNQVNIKSAFRITRTFQILYEISDSVRMPIFMCFSIFTNARSSLDIWCFIFENSCCQFFIKLKAVQNWSSLSAKMQEIRKNVVKQNKHCMTFRLKCLLYLALTWETASNILPVKTAISLI